MRLDNSNEEVIEYYNLYFNPEDPGMTEPVDLCNHCSEGWPAYLFVEHPDYDDDEYFCFQCGEEL